MSKHDEVQPFAGDGRERSETNKPERGGDSAGLVLYLDSNQSSKLENESIGEDSDSSSKDPLKVLGARSRSTRRLQQRQTILTVGPRLIQISTIDEQKAADRKIRQESARRERREYLDQLTRNDPEFVSLSEQISVIDSQIDRRQRLADRSHRAWRRFVRDYKIVSSCRSYSKKEKAKQGQPTRSATVIINDGIDPPFEMNLRTLIRSDLVISQMREEHSRRLAVHHRNRRNAERERVTKLRRRRMELESKQREIRARLAMSRNPGQRNMVTGFSNQSQAQMFRTFASLDLSPMAGRKLVMVTLTYPLDWQTVAGSSKQTQRHLRRFRSRYGSEFGEPCAALVKLEFQQRGAPHHHLLTTLPPTGRSGLPFREWISRTWADIVNHLDPEQRELHEKAGTRVDEMTGSPSKVVGYFAKYSMFKDKRYQHVVPREWLDTGGARRFWTSWALEKDLHSTYLDPTRDAKDIRRGLRDVDRARRKRKPTYRKHYTYLANEVNYETGEIRLRKVKRSTDLFRMSGGFLLIDNPMKIVDQITRNLEVNYPRNE